MPIIPLFIFFFGAALGSFLNVVILRHRRESINGRSKCPSCTRTLTWWQLIPIFSFIILRGRCSSCHATISIQYPLIELVMGLSALITFTPLPTSTTAFASSFLTFVIIAILIILFTIDLKTLLLPDSFTVILTTIILSLLIIKQPDLTITLTGLVTGTGLLALLWVITSGHGLGLGDVKLMIPLGVLFGGLDIMVLLLVSFISGGIIAGWLLLTKRATMKTAVPFGPFLAGTAIIFLLIPSLPITILSLLLG